MANIKKSMGLLFLFFLVTLMLCFLLSKIRGNEVRVINSEDYLTSPYYKVKLTTDGNISKEEFLDIIKDVEILYKNSKSLGKKAVYFGSQNKYKPQLKQCNYFTNQDFLSGDLIGVGGSSFLSQKTKIIDGKMIYNSDDFFDGIPIRMIDEIITTPFDQKSNNWYINLGALIDYEGIEGVYYYNGAKDLFYHQNNNLHVEFLENDQIKWSAFNFFNNDSLKIMVAAGIIFLCLLLIINMTLLWMNSYQKEVAVRRACGGTKIRILKRLVLIYWSTALSSCTLAIIVFWLLSKKSTLDKMLGIYQTSLVDEFLGILGIKEIIFTVLIIFGGANIIFFFLCLNSLKKTLATKL